MQNYIDTVLSQWGNSPNILALLESWNDSLDPGVNIDDFYAKVWDIDTAQGYGLDVWGRIVGVSRVVTVQTTIDAFGFEEATDAQPFGQEAFYSGPVTENYSLSDDAFRALILVKALANLSNSSIQAYNTMLMQLFPGRGNAYVVDNKDMSANVVFEFALSDYEKAIIEQSGAFAPPTGVLFNVVITGTYSYHSAVLGHALLGAAILATTP